MTYTKEQIIKALDWISSNTDYIPPWVGDAVDYHLEQLKKPEKRRLKQNRLAFKWHKERADFFHNTPDYEHRFCKLHYGCPILCAEDEDFLDYFVAVILPLPYEKQIKAMKHIDVTSLMTVKQFSEYLNTIEVETAKEGCILTHPDEYMDALMRQVA